MSKEGKMKGRRKGRRQRASTRKQKDRKDGIDQLSRENSCLVIYTNIYIYMCKIGIRGGIEFLLVTREINTIH